MSAGGSTGMRRGDMSGRDDCCRARSPKMLRLGDNDEEGAVLLPFEAWVS